MKRRVIAAVTAILLAAVSAVVLLRYVSGADERAMAGMQPVTVFVVIAQVPEGTAADGLTDLVAEKAVPKSTVASGAVHQLQQIAGKVANTDLEVGEQLLASRFSDPESLQAEDEIKIPDGHEQLSLQLDPQRVLGGHLQPGARVGIFVSIGDNLATGRTHLTLNRVLVTRVQGALVDTGSSGTPDDGSQTTAETSTETSADETTTADAVPQNSMIVTFAVTAPQAEKIVFAAEYGTMWLSLEDKDASTTGTRIVTEENEHS